MCITNCYVKFSCSSLVDVQDNIQNFEINIVVNECVEEITNNPLTNQFFKLEQDVLLTHRTHVYILPKGKTKAPNKVIKM